MNKIISATQKSKSHELLNELTQQSIATLPDILKEITDQYTDSDQISQKLKGSGPIQALYLLYHLQQVDLSIQQIDLIAKWFSSMQEPFSKTGCPANQPGTL